MHMENDNYSIEQISSYLPYRFYIECPPPPPGNATDYDKIRGAVD